VLRGPLQPVRSGIRNGLDGRGDPQRNGANNGRAWRLCGRQRRGTTAVAARTTRIGKMLDLIMIAVVTVTDEPIVMIALVVMRDGRTLVSRLIRQRRCRLQDPGFVRDSTAEQHRGCREGLKRQCQQKDCGSSPEKSLLHIKRISQPWLAPSASPEQCVQRAEQSQMLDHHQNDHPQHDRC